MQPSPSADTFNTPSCLCFIGTFMGESDYDIGMPSKRSMTPIGVLGIIGLGVVVLGTSAGRASQAGNEPVTIRVDTTVIRGPMYPFWAWFGHDEPNYTYTPNGMKLLSQLQALSPVPV